MASHFLVYRSVESSLPVACSTDADKARKFAASDLPRTAVVVRALAGKCPVCNRLISRVAMTESADPEAKA